MVFGVVIFFVFFIPVSFGIMFFLYPFFFFSYFIYNDNYWKYIYFFILQTYIEKIITKLIMSKSLFNKKILFFIYIFISIISFFRSIFLPEKENSKIPIFFLIIFLIILISLLYLKINVTNFIFSYIVIGVYFLVWDVYGELFANIILNDMHSQFSIGYFMFITKIKQKKYLRFYGTKSAFLFFGKSGLTSTGKASLIVGGFASITLTYNNYLDRKFQENEARLDREFKIKQQELQQIYDSQEAAKNRKFLIYQQEYTNWSKRPIWRKNDPAPKWQEDI